MFLTPAVNSRWESETMLSIPSIWRRLLSSHISGRVADSLGDLIEAYTCGNSLNSGLLRSINFASRIA